MNKLDVLSRQFRQEITDLLVPIQTSKVIEKTEFESMRKTLEEISELLKDIEMVSKKLTNEIYVTIKVLRQEANFFKKKINKSLMIWPIHSNLS